MRQGREDLFECLRGQKNAIVQIASQTLNILIDSLL